MSRSADPAVATLDAAPLPDVAADVRSENSGALDRVGMTGIEVALRLPAAGGGETLVPGRVDAFVSLDDPAVKGIHMSRLFLAVQDAFADRPLSWEALERLTAGFVDSHAGLSRTAQVSVRYEHLVRRESLVSGKFGWRSYPVRLSTLARGDDVGRELAVRLTYSSACPCSTALSQRLLTDQLRGEFAGRDLVPLDDVADWLAAGGVGGIPHSQRSTADVTVVPAAGADVPAADLIDRLEAVLTTPVQAAVKRIDEQEFARLNAVQPMFCEDAARLLRASLEDHGAVADWRVQVNHHESLHPHDATAIVAKGIPGGLRP